MITARSAAVAGAAALEYINEREQLLSDAASTLKSSPAELSARVTGLLEERKKLEKELKEVKSQLANARQNSDTEKAGLVTSLETRNQQISDLEKKYSEISDQLTSVETENRELRAKLDTQKDDMLLKYFTYGGGVAGLGLLFGLVLPHLIPRRKKSPAGWA